MLPSGSSPAIAASTPVSCGVENTSAASGAMATAIRPATRPVIPISVSSVPRSRRSRSWRSTTVPENPMSAIQVRKLAASVARARTPKSAGAISLASTSVVRIETTLAPA